MDAARLVRFHANKSFMSWKCPQWSTFNTPIYWISWLSNKWQNMSHLPSWLLGLSRGCGPLPLAYTLRVSDLWPGKVQNLPLKMHSLLNAYIQFSYHDNVKQSYVEAVYVQAHTYFTVILKSKSVAVTWVLCIYLTLEESIWNKKLTTAKGQDGRELQSQKYHKVKTQQGRSTRVNKGTN